MLLRDWISTPMHAEPAPGGGAPPAGTAPTGDPAPAAAAAPAPNPAAAPAVAPAPVEYQFQFEEKGVVIPDSVKTEAKAFAEKHKLPAEAAGEIAKLINSTAGAFPAKYQEEVTALRNQWAEDAKADQEIGGEKFDENIALAKHALEQFGNEDLTKLLNETGLGNHPAVIRAFYKIGALIKQDSVAAAISGSSAPAKSAATLLYPNNPSAGN